jgi:S1-C subfamily serine protease
MGIFSIVWIIMKYSLIIFICILLTSCAIEWVTDETLRSRIVDIEWRWGEMSRWVILETGRVMTVRHGVDACIEEVSWAGTYPSLWCAIIHWGQRYPITTITLPDMRRDIALLEYTSGESYTSLRQSSELSLRQEIYILTSTGKFSGQIISLTPSYIAYDTHLSGSLLSWAIMTDIVVERGESGTPIWTLSGELIWVVSAVDIVGKRSYGVR